MKEHPNVREPRKYAEKALAYSASAQKKEMTIFHPMSKVE
jgi:hypothetical protein